MANYNNIPSLLALEQDNPEALADYQTRQARQSIANLLIQQGLQPIQGQQVGRFYSQPNWAQGLAQLASAGLGGYLTNQIGQQGLVDAQKQAEAVKTSQQEVAKAMMSQARPDVPAVPAQELAGPGMPVQAMQPGPPINAGPRTVPGPMQPMLQEGPRPMSEAIPAQPAVEDPMAARLQRVQQVLAAQSPWLQKQNMPFAQLMEKQSELAQRGEEQTAKLEETKALREQTAAYQQSNLDNARRALDQSYQANMDRLSDTRFTARERAGLEQQQRDIERERLGVDRQKLDIERSRLAKEKLPTDAQGAANLYANRATNAHETLSNLEGQYSPLALDFKERVGKTWVFGGMLEGGVNKALSKESQQADQAQRDFVNAILRKESGAVINKEEFENARKQYFPQPGDGPDVLLQKRQNRETEIEGLRSMSGTLNPTRQAGAPSPATAPKALPHAKQAIPSGPYQDPEKERRYQEYLRTH